MILNNITKVITKMSANIHVLSDLRTIIMIAAIFQSIGTITIYQIHLVFNVRCQRR